MCLHTEDAEEECKLNPKRKLDMDLPQRDQGQERTFKSPGFNRRRFYNRFFCLYNITLECPGRHAELTAKARTISFEDNCGDYLAIYSNSSQKNPDKKICGNEFLNFRMTLNSHFFIAVLWTNSNLNSGRFEIEAKCGKVISSTTTASNKEVEDVGDYESEDSSGVHFDLTF